jgi:hypothetical protein
MDEFGSLFHRHYSKVVGNLPRYVEKDSFPNAPKLGEGHGAPEGTEHVWRDGERYKKTGGKWVHVESGSDEHGIPHEDIEADYQDKIAGRREPQLGEHRTERRKHVTENDGVPHGTPYHESAAKAHDMSMRAHTFDEHEAAGAQHRTSATLAPSEGEKGEHERWAKEHDVAIVKKKEVIGKRREKNQKILDAIHAHMKAGGHVIHATQLRATKLSKPEHIRMSPSGFLQIPRGRHWDVITDEEHLARQAGLKLGD